MKHDIRRMLEEGRAREKEQTLFYRALAAEAETRGREDLVERLNDLHADEQHHLSRLTVRLLELGETPEGISVPIPSIPGGGVWEGVARNRENGEVAWYRKALEAELDPDTEALLREILASEEHHSRELGGKWMSA